MQGWLLAQYVLYPQKVNSRYCIIEDYRTLVEGDVSVRPQGGAFHYREILGNYAVVKVAGVSAATVTSILNDPLIRRFPAVQFLADNLGVLSDVQWANYRQFALDLGYPAAEWDAVFGGAGQQGSYTLRDVITFVVRRRISPRFDIPTQTIVLDGPVVQPAAVADEIDSVT